MAFLFQSPKWNLPDWTTLMTYLLWSSFQTPSETFPCAPRYILLLKSRCRHICSGSKFPVHPWDVSEIPTPQQPCDFSPAPPRPPAPPPPLRLCPVLMSVSRPSPSSSWNVRSIYLTSGSWPSHGSSPWPLLCEASVCPTALPRASVAPFLFLSHLCSSAAF